MRSLLAAGATLSFGSDWPVSSYAPLEGLAVAVTRADPSGRPAGGWLPQERLPPEAALAAYTAGTAHQAFEAHERGSLLPGAYADLVHLSGDPYAVPAQEWPDLTVRGTWVQGVSTSAANITDP
jgi:predicted amidohydrolase YtcJ